MYWENIHPDIIAAQKSVLMGLGYSVDHVAADGVQHGAWLDDTLARGGDDDVFLFLDIDAFPLTAQVVEQAFAEAEAGGVFGVAQTANHLADKNYVYAAPSFLAVRKSTWTKVGRISMMPTDTDDVAMAFTKAARAARIPVTTLMPSYCCRPVWPVADLGCSGTGTFYAGQVFHLFQSRLNTGYDVILHAVARQVLAGQPIDYVALNRQVNSVAVWWSNRRAAMQRRAAKWRRSLEKRMPFRVRPA